MQWLTYTWTNERRKWSCGRDYGRGWVSPDRMMTEVFCGHFYHAVVQLGGKKAQFEFFKPGVVVKTRKNLAENLSDCGAIAKIGICWKSGRLDLIWPPKTAESSLPGWPGYHHGKPGNGRPHSPHQQAPGRLQLHRPELQLGSAANSGGRRPERRKKLRAGEFRREVVSCLWILGPEADFESD